jgi:hypothetical protein
MLTAPARPTVTDFESALGGRGHLSWQLPGQKAARAEFRDLEIDVAHLGGEQARAVAVAVTKPILTAFVAIGTEHSGNLELDQLLQAVAHQFGNELPSCAAIQ